MKFSNKDFFSKYDQLRWKLRICFHLVKKSLMKNLIFYAVLDLFMQFINYNKYNSFTVIFCYCLFRTLSDIYNPQKVSK